MQLELLSSIPQFGYVIFVAQLRGARSMHILNSIQEMLVWVNGGRQQNIHQNSVINCLLCCRMTCLGHMQTATNNSHGNKCLFQRSREAESSFEFIKATLPSLKLRSLMLISRAVIIMFQHLTNTQWASTIEAKYDANENKKSRFQL